MTWRDAKSEAAALIETLRLPPGAHREIIVVLHEFENERAYNFYCGMNGWTLPYYIQVQRAVFRALKPRVTIKRLLICLPDSR